MEYDVFFSYPHKDTIEVEQILKTLQTIGLTVWIDKREICQRCKMVDLGCRE